MITVAIADDHAVVRGGLEQLLAAEPDMQVVGTATDGAEAHELATREQPQVFLMDLSMPRMDGIEATRRIATDTPDVHVVVLTSFVDQERILDALAAGAVGYILKDSEAREVAAAVRAAARSAASGWRS